MNNQLSKHKSINKIVVVGHPLSGFQAVETLLNSRGMKPARPSRRDGFLPGEISATLCKAHRVSPLDPLQSEAEIEQIDAGPIWHGMALDLLLGNIDQEFWGWADPQAVYFLDYWKGLDPQLAFVLVYDTPEQLVAQAFDQQTSLSPEALRQATDNWSAYNAALLHFYHRNPERCLLVNAQQVRESAGTYVQQMRTCIGASSLLTDRPSPDDDGAVEAAPYPAEAPPQDALKAYIAHALIQQQPETIQLYEELQSVANLPLAERGTEDPYTPMDAWVSMTEAQARNTEQVSQAQAQAQAQEAQIQALGQDLSSTEALARERLQQVAQLEQAQTAARQRAQEQEQENELLLLQLYQVQEELERHYLEGRQQKEKIKTLQEIEKLANERAKEIEKLSQDKVKLSTEKDSQAKLANERASQIEQENELLLPQLHQVQEELERYYLENQRLKEKTSPAQPAKPPVVNPELEQENELLRLQLHRVQEELGHYILENQHLKQKVAKPPKPKYYGAADRVKQQLSYRLGAIMIQRSHSLTGWFGMPLALLREAREHRRKAPEREAQKLPPVARYEDAYEAERVKQHLSYRLGAAMLANTRFPLGWLKMPFTLIHTALVFKRSRGRN